MYAYLLRPDYDLTTPDEPLAGLVLLPILPRADANALRPKPDTVTPPRDPRTGLPGMARKDYVVVLRPHVMPVKDGDFIQRVGAFSADADAALGALFDARNLESRIEGFIPGQGNVWERLGPGAFVQQNPDREKPQPRTRRTKKPGTKHTRRHGAQGAAVGKVIDLTLDDAHRHYGLPDDIAQALGNRTLRAAIEMPGRDLAKLMPAEPELTDDMPIGDAEKLGLIEKGETPWDYLLTKPARGSKAKKLTTLGQAFAMASDNPRALADYGGMGAGDTRTFRRDILRAKDRFQQAAARSGGKAQAETLKSVWNRFVGDFAANKGPARKIVIWSTPTPKK